MSEECDYSATMSSFYQVIMSMCEELQEASKYSLMKWKIMRYFDNYCCNMVLRVSCISKWIISGSIATDGSHGIISPEHNEAGAVLLFPLWSFRGCTEDSL